MKKGLSHIVVQLLLSVLFLSNAYADFGLMVGSFRNKDGARKYQKTLTEQKYNAFIEEVRMSDKGLWHRVSVGPFDTKQEALNHKKLMRSEGFTGDIRIVSVNTASTAYKSNIQEKNTSRQTEDSVDIKSIPASTVQTDTGRTAAKPVSETRKDITLTWDASRDPDLAGYRVYYDTDPNPPYDPDEADYADEGPPPVTVAKDVTEITLHGLTGNRGYFFTITSFDKSGSESPFSDEVTTFRSGSPKRRADKGPESKQISNPARPATPPSPVKQTPIEEIPGKSSGSFVEPVSLVTAGDTLKIEVPGQMEMSKDYDVDPSGSIYMIIAGKLEVQGLNVDDLASRLTARLERYIGKGDKITVELLDQQRFIYIQGGVWYPGWYHVPYISKLEDLLNLSGGFIPGANFDGIKLRRKIPDGYMDVEIKDKIALEPDDIVSVPLPDKYGETIDKGDVLFISIPQRQAPSSRPDQRDSADLRESFTRNKVETDANGYVYIPDHGHIYVNGLTPEEIARTITERLPKYMAILGKVRVSIIEKRHFVQILGHVSNPGWYNVLESANIQEALVAAGGPVDGAVMSEVSIQRRTDEGVQAIKVNLYQYTVTGDPRLLTPIHENDIIFVPISSSFGDIKRVLMAWSPPAEKLEQDVKKKVRIFGAVHNPGIYEPLEDMDLLDLLGLASGETVHAELSNIVIIRNNRVALRFNLTEWLDSADDSIPMPKLYNGDTVYVNYVEITTHESRERIYIVGKVKGPGSYELYPDMTVLQALAWAGGLDEWADSKNITIVRMVDGKQENIRFNYDKGVTGKYPELNIRMEPNDTIIVP